MNLSQGRERGGQRGDQAGSASDLGVHVGESVLEVLGSERAHEVVQAREAAETEQVEGVLRGDLWASYTLE